MTKKIMALLISVTMVFTMVGPICADAVTQSLAVTGSGDIVISSETAGELGIGEVQEDGSVVISDEDLNELLGMGSSDSGAAVGSAFWNALPGCDQNCGQDADNVGAHMDGCAIKVYYRALWDDYDAVTLAKLWEKLPEGARAYLLDEYSWTDQSKRTELMALLEPAEEEPVEEEPVEEEPVEEEPTEEEPTEEEPIEEEPVEEEPIEEEPIEEEPIEEEPIEEEPVEEEPVEEEPVEGEPVEGEPVDGEPVEEDGGLVCDQECGQEVDAVGSHGDGCAVKVYYRTLWDDNDAAALAELWDSLPEGAQSYLLDNYSWTDQAKRAELVELLEEQEDPEEPEDPDDPEDSNMAPPCELEQTVGDTTVQVSGYDMEGVSMSVSEVPEEEWDQDIYKYTAGNPVEFALDITLFDDNGEWQPSGGSVKVILDAADYGWEEGQVIGIAHEHEGVVRYLGSDVVKGGKLEFETEGFSTFYGFTVDFHYEGIMFSIQGMSSIYLHELFDEMDIDLDAAQAVNVEFSDPELLTVTQDENGWLLTSQTAFLTEEALTVTFADGSRFVMRVTDASDQSCDSNVKLGSDDYTKYITGGTLTKSRTWTAVKSDKTTYIKGTVTIPSEMILKIRTGTDEKGHYATTIRRHEDLTDGALFVVKEGGLLIINGESSDLDITLHGGAVYTDGWDDTQAMSAADATKLAVLDNHYAGTDTTKRNKVVNNTGLAANAALIDCAGSLWMEYTTLQNNDVTIRHGGGIRLKGGGSGEVYIARCMFRYLRSPMGSAIYMGSWSGSDGAINKMEVDYTGGNGDGYGIRIYDSTFHRNMTFEILDENGTGSFGGTIRASGTTSTNMIVEQCDFYYNWTHWNGGGIYWNAGGTNFGEGVTNTQCMVRDCRFDNNYAGNSGGAIFAETDLTLKVAAKNGWAPGYGPNSDESFDGIIITNNDAGVIRDKDSFGGGICVTIYSREEVPQFSGLGYDVELTTGVLISGNEVKNAGYGGGVGIYCRNSKNEITTPVSCKVTGATITNNKAPNGGGIAFVDEASKINGMRTFTVSGGEISGNTASENGGGIYIVRRSGAIRGKMNTITLSGGSIHGNKATGGSGGGVYCRADGTDVALTLSGSVVVGKSGSPNTASSGGGGILVEAVGSNGTLTFKATGGSCSYNTASGSGGGIRLFTSGAGSDLTATLSGGSFNNNTAKWGGGVNIKPTASGDGTCVVTISGATINSNKVSGDSGSNGGGVYIDSTTTSTAANACKVTISSGNVKGNDSAKNGGGVSVYKTGTGTVNLTISGGTISGNHAVYGGGVFLSNTTTGNLNANISNGTVGGAALATGAGTGDVGNVADEDGGGYYILNSGAGGIYPTISGGTVKYNKAKDGGGLYLTATDGNVVAEVSGGTVTYNQAATSGGGYMCYSNGADPNLDLTLTGGTISYNKATGGNGGGIYAKNENSKATLNVDLELHTDGTTTAKIFSNTASNMGGGIYLAAASPERAKNDDGTDHANVHLKLNKGEIYSNTAKSGGGVGMYSTNAGYMLLNLSGVNVYSNNAAGNGGGFYCYMLNSSKQAINLSGGTVGSSGKGNTAGAAGGGVYVDTQSTDTTALNLKGTSVSYNTAATNGGGYAIVQNGTGAVTVSITNSPKTDYNQATGSGGGMYLRNQTTGDLSLSVSNGSISHNTSGKMGGGIYLQNDDSTGSLNATFTSGNINNNTALHGGGIAQWGGTMTLAAGTGGGTQIIGNSATAASGVGGGICVMEGELTINGGMIGKNTAYYIGGGVGTSTMAADYPSPAGVTVTLNGGAITQNTAVYGGGVGTWGSALTVGDIGKTTINAEGTTIGEYDTYTGNTAYTGGGICLIGGELNMTGGSVVGNRAYGGDDSSGGGILVMYASDASYQNVFTAALNLDGGSVISNTATGYGGGIATSDPTNLLVTVNIKGGTVGASGAGNAAPNGGGIAIGGGTVTIDAGSASYNYAAKVNAAGQFLDSNGDVTTTDTNYVFGDGGGVMIYSGNLIVKGGTVSYNKAQYGGGIYVFETTSQASAAIWDGDIIWNTAYGIGGGIAAEDADETDGETGDILTLYGGNISNNTARHGGGVALWGGNVTMAEGTGGGTRITGNSATAANGVGGGVCVMEGELTINGGMIAANTAYYMGGGVGTSTMAAEYPSPNGVTINLSGGAISQNAALYGGGVGTWGSSKAVEDESGEITIGKTTINAEGTTIGAYDTYTGNAAVSGGGISMNGGALNMTGGSVVCNRAYGDDASSGGGILVMYASVLNSDGQTYSYYPAVLNLQDGDINGNTATGYGGGIATSDPTNLLVTVNITGGTVGASGAGNAAPNGGGIAIGGGEVTLTEGSISYNYAAKVNAAGQFLNSDGAETTAEAEYVFGDGGGVMIYSGKLIVNAGTVSYNKAQHGGGIYVFETTSQASAAIRGGDITWNYAYGIGGGIAARDDNETDDAREDGTIGDILTMEGGTVSDNQARHGGGVALWGGNVTMDIGVTRGTSDGVQITRNSAYAENGVGGGICVMEGKITLNGGVIGGNTAAFLGGGIGTSTMSDYASPNGVTVTLSGGAIANNTALYGGGLGSWGTAEAVENIGKTTINFKGSTVGTYGTYLGNYAYSGGGICLNGGELNMDGGAVTGNTASYGVGGGILIMYGSNSLGVPSYSAKMEMVGGVINKNSTGGSGGGVAIVGYDETDTTEAVPATFTITSGAIHENTAANGGGVYIYGVDSSLTMNGGYLVGNKAVGTPAGVTTAADPTAAGLAGVGGGVFVQSGTFTMTRQATSRENDTNLHSNLAEFAADDVYSSELGIVDLPAVGEMALSYPSLYAGDKPTLVVTDWFEDYANEDSAYGSGLEGQNFSNGSSDIMRYRAADAMEPVKANYYKVVNTKTSISGTYVALTLGIETAYVQVEKVFMIGKEPAVDRDDSFGFSMGYTDHSGDGEDTATLTHGGTWGPNEDGSGYKEIRNDTDFIAEETGVDEKRYTTEIKVYIVSEDDQVDITNDSSKVTIEGTKVTVHVKDPAGYVKIVYINTLNVADLTLQKDGWDPIDENQTFLFRVKGDPNDENTQNIDLTVMIDGKKGTLVISQLPVGKYTVTELNGWSWRYSTQEVTAKAADNADLKVTRTDGSNEAAFELTQDTTLTWTNQRDDGKWMDGNSWCQNVFLPNNKIKPIVPEEKEEEPGE